MEVITSIREKYHEGFRRKHGDIYEIVLHGASGDSAKALIKWMLGGERKNQYNDGIALFHYIIDFDGTIFEIIDPDKWVYHSSSGKHDRHTIGIEHMHKGKHGEFTIDTYQASLDLVFNNIMENYNITSIVGHGANRLKYSGKHKDCPGDNFKWDIYANELIARGYTFTQQKERFNDITIS